MLNERVLVPIAHMSSTIAIMKFQLTSVILAATVFFGAAVASPVPKPQCAGSRSLGGPVKDCTA